MLPHELAVCCRMRRLQVLHKDVPDADDVAEAAGQDEEVEGAVGVGAVGAYCVEDGAGDVHHAFCDEPHDGGRTDASHQRLEGHEHRETHQHVAGGFHVAVLFQIGEAHHRAGNGAEPHETKQAPSPEACVAHGNQGDGAVAAGDVPVDGGMVEAA